MDLPVAATPAGGRRARRAGRGPRTVDVDVVVVGAGQAGLAVAYHLQRTGLVPVGSAGWERARGTFVVLDEAPRAGGAWQHRWRSLTMADAHHVHDLPGMPLTVVDAAEPAADAVPYYFAQYEEAFGLNVQRPVHVVRVERAPAVDGAPRYAVTTRHVDDPAAVVVWTARGLVNASGTWGRPFWPAYPGRETFTGRQLHVRDFRSAGDLADGHVVVVGGGTSAVQLLLQVAEVTGTTWVTRRPPTWRDEEFTPELGREAVSRVDERVRAGLPPESVVSVTGLPLTPAYRAGIAAGVLRARRVFTRIVADGVEWDGAGEPGVSEAGAGVPGVSAGGATGAGSPAGASAAGTGSPRGAGSAGASATGASATVAGWPAGADATGAGWPAGADATGAGWPAGADATGAASTRGAVGPGRAAAGGGAAESAAGAGVSDVAALGGWVDGPSSVQARTILWATGFRASLDHLAPLGLRGPGGGILMDGTEVVDEPHVQLVGYGPSASTIGATRAARDAVRRLRRHLSW